MQELILFTSNPNINYMHLVLDEIQQADNLTLICTSENKAQFHYLLLKQGIKMDDYIKSGKLQQNLLHIIRIIDLFSQNIADQEELPLTENTPKLWMDQSQDYKKDLKSYLVSTIKHQNIFIENLFYFDIQCKERNQNPLQILQSLMKYKTIHIYMPIVNINSYLQLTAFLTKYAKKIVQLLPNQSGFSKDIDGSILIELRNPQKPSVFQKQIYHVEQNNVKYVSALQIV